MSASSKEQLHVNDTHTRSSEFADVKYDYAQKSLFTSPELLPSRH